MVMRPFDEGRRRVRIREVPHLHEEVRQRLTVRLGLGTSLFCRVEATDLRARGRSVHPGPERAGWTCTPRMMPSISASVSSAGVPLSANV